jgi:hypothetical protein
MLSNTHEEISITKRILIISRPDYMCHSYIKYIAYMDHGRSDHHIYMIYQHIFGHTFGAYMGLPGYLSIRPLAF